MLQKCKQSGVSEIKQVNDNQAIKQYMNLKET